MAIYLSETGFITLTLSAIETSIKYESSGYLLGYKVGKTFFVENVIPYQIARRTPDSIDVHPLKRRRIQKVFKNYMKYRIIGEFHTHPEGGIKLSMDDKEYIRDNNYELEIVVAITKGDGESPWDYAKGVLSGSIDKYFIQIAGWRVYPKKVVKQTLQCPFAVGFDFSKPIE